MGLSNPVPNQVAVRTLGSDKNEVMGLGEEMENIAKEKNVSGWEGYSTVTDLARLRGWSTSVPFKSAVW